MKTDIILPAYVNGVASCNLQVRGAVQIHGTYCRIPGQNDGPVTVHEIRMMAMFPDTDNDFAVFVIRNEMAGYPILVDEATLLSQYPNNFTLVDIVPTDNGGNFILRCVGEQGPFEVPVSAQSHVPGANPGLLLTWIQTPADAADFIRD